MRTNEAGKCFLSNYNEATDEKNMKDAFNKKS